MTKETARPAPTSATGLVQPAGAARCGASEVDGSSGSLNPAGASHRANLERVRRAIATSVREFCDAHVGHEFHAQELRDYVARVHPTAPASADRILRDLRQRGDVRYVLVSRSRSLYRVEWCK